MYRALVPNFPQPSTHFHDTLEVRHFSALDSLGKKGSRERSGPILLDPHIMSNSCHDYPIIGPRGGQPCRDHCFKVRE